MMEQKETKVDNVRVVVDESMLHKIINSIDELEAENKRLNDRIERLYNFLGLRS